VAADAALNMICGISKGQWLASMIKTGAQISKKQPNKHAVPNRIGTRTTV
jgi:hypothetical protein